MSKKQKKTNNEIFKFTPEFHGIRLDIIELWHRLFNSSNNKTSGRKKKNNFPNIMKKIFFVVIIFTLLVFTLLGREIYSYLINRLNNTPSSIKFTPKNNGGQKIYLRNYSISQNKDISGLLTKIRTDDKLREITALESEKTLNTISNNTYAFLSATNLEIGSQSTFSEIFEKKVKRFNEYPSLYFEIHKFNDNKVELLGFISEETLSKINPLDSETTKNIVIFPTSYEEFNHLILISIDQIISINNREIAFNKGKKNEALDLKLK